MGEQGSLITKNSKEKAWLESGGQRPTGEKRSFQVLGGEGVSSHHKRQGVLKWGNLKRGGFSLGDLGKLRQERRGKGGDGQRSRTPVGGGKRGGGGGGGGGGGEEGGGDQSTRRRDNFQAKSRTAREKSGPTKGKGGIQKG